MTNDILGNEIKAGDYVISFNHLYIVLSVNGSYARIMLSDKSKTTRAQNRYSKEMVVVTKIMNGIGK